MMFVNPRADNILIKKLRFCRRSCFIWI